MTKEEKRRQENNLIESSMYKNEKWISWVPEGFLETLEKKHELLEP